MSNTELEPRVLRLWDQLRYAYEHGGGHSGHLNNALHTAKALSKELCKAESERDALLAALKEAVECDGGDDGLFHACCGESFWTAHDVECWVPKAKAAIDAARGEK